MVRVWYFQLKVGPKWALNIFFFWLKSEKIVKNSQFWSNQFEIEAILPTHGLVILTKFHYNWAKIIQLKSDETAQLLNKPYVNEVTLRGQK